MNKSLMKSCLIREVADQIRGVSYKPTQVSERPLEGYVKLLRANNITENGVEYNDIIYVEKSCVSPNQILKEGDILIAASSGSKSIVGKAAQVGISSSDISFGAFCKVIRPKELINKRYLGYYFQSSEYRKTISHLSAGANINNIRNDDLDNLTIPLPPLPVQEQIAATLDKADALRRKDQELLQKYDELAQAIFYDMFGDPVRNDKGWEMKKMDEILEDIIGGTSVSGEEKELQKGEFGVLKISSVTTGTFIPDEYKVPDQIKLPKIMIHPKKGDLLFSRANTRELVAATAVVNENYNNLFLPDKIWKLKPHKHASPYYLKFILSDQGIRSKLTKTATGTSGSMLNISMQKLKSLKIPFPNHSIQLSFETRIKYLLDQKVMLIKTLERSNKLFQNTLTNFFKSEM